MSGGVNVEKITEWRSLLVLVVFVLTNAVVLFPFNVPIPIPVTISNALLDTLGHLRVIQQRQTGSIATQTKPLESEQNDPRIKWLQFPFNYLTAPLIAVLFLLATTAITRKEVYNGTVGTDNIYPLEIMAFFITLAYIAISIDASGLIRWLSLKVLRKGGKNGRLLFLYLYLFFFTLASFIGNDPIVLSGTPFLAYMTRLSSNIRDPKAWIYTQFSVANIASAMLVTSNPTNLVLAGAFDIKFIDYTANMIVPVMITVILYFPFLLFGLFNDESLIPRKIEMHDSSTSSSGDERQPTNPNIPFAGGVTEEDKDPNTEAGKLLSIDEVMNPYLDKKSAIFASSVMAVTLVTVLAVNAASSKAYPAYWITAPAAFVVLCWDVATGWRNRHESRRISREGRRLIDRRREEEAGRCTEDEKNRCSESNETVTNHTSDASFTPRENEKPTGIDHVNTTPRDPSTPANLSTSPCQHNANNNASPSSRSPVAPRTTLTTLASRSYLLASETFPTAVTVLTHLPFPLVPFGLCMFILVEALVSAGWIQCFAWGWNDWVNLTGTVGAIGGMGVLGVVLCNTAGTNIGTTILLSRLIQSWLRIHPIHPSTQPPITTRTFEATIYALALGLNYGAFSTAFSASLAGMLWRSILARKHIFVGRWEFARVNAPLIAFAMVVGCVVLVGEVWVWYPTSVYREM